MNIEKLLKIMSEKNTRLPLLRDQDWKTVKAETGKNKRIINIYLNKQHHETSRN